VATRDTMLFTLTTNRVQASTNIAVISGTAPLEVTTLMVGGATWPATWSSTVAWSIKMPVAAGTNTFAVLGYDRQGRLVAGASNTVTVANSVAPEDPVGNVVINEIMHLPLVPDAEYVELFNNSSNVAFNLSGWRFNGLGYTFPNGSFIMPGSYLTLVKDRFAYTSAYGMSAPVFDVFSGNLQGDGETLSLLQPGATPTEEVVIDRVRYESATPWPLAATNGTALQLIDPKQDNSRVSNWSDGSGWRFCSFTGNSGSSSGARLSFYFESSGGNVYLDDMSFVLLSGPNAGSNLLQNADFELPLGTNTVLGTNNWITSAVTVASAVVTNFARSGNSCLRFNMNAAPAQPSYFYQYLPFVIPAQTSCMISFWYLPGTKGTNLNIYLNSGFRPAARVTPPTPATPGMSNSIAATMTEYPPLWLNEVQPLNTNGITDRFGEREPWVELYNSGTNPVSLDGLFLADSYTNLAQWAFPTGLTINPAEFKVIFCDGQAEQSTNVELHASFRLLPGSGTVALSRLYKGQPQIFDYLTYRDVPPDHSYGDLPDGQPFYRRVMYHYTAGQTNTGALAPVIVKINEWMANNTYTLPDPAENYHYNDWLELFNPGSSPADLSGYYLTDSLTNRFQFRIPAGFVVPPGGYLLVWADNEPTLNTNRTDLHVNFKLNTAGEAIGLFDPDGFPIDTVVFGRQTNDVSEGRYPDGAAARYFMPQPTPRAANRIPLPPSPPQLVGASLGAGNGNFSFAFGTVAGRAYQVEYIDNLTNRLWTRLAPTHPGDGSPVTVIYGTTNSSQRFYRVVIVP
jgi:hypothetical protein